MTITLKKISISVLLFILVTTLTLTLVVGRSSFAIAATSEKDLEQVLKDNGINVPEEIKSVSGWEEIVEKFVNESSPNAYRSFSYNKTYEFFEELSQKNSLLAEPLNYYSTYQLQDSLVQNQSGDWVSNDGYFKQVWENYNCYAYSINRVEQPNFYSSFRQYQPGDFVKNGQEYYMGMSVYNLANIIKPDLEAMGMSNVNIFDYIPSLEDNQELICVRVGSQDYHFMRYDKQTDAWYHKPGSTAVLKYKYIPSNDRIWTNEYSWYGSENSGTIEYDSDIKFIRYTKNTYQVPHSSQITKKVLAGKDVFYEINVNEKFDYSWKISSSHTLVAKMYNSEMNLLWSQSGLSFSKKSAMKSGKYYLQLYFDNSSTSDIITIQVSPTHVYNYSYTWVDGTQHKAYCECGEYKLQKHYVASTSPLLYAIGPGQYKTCLYCHGRADMGFVLSQGIRNSFATPNGSYILPNGVRVIAPNDMDALFNGTLVFYSKNAFLAA